jgi:Raf kinase inhibitor-like YbhB/YbcL family protein
MNMEFRLLSKAFKNGELIPDLYSNTRLGKNISPPLNWENPPEQTKGFAIIVEDVDAPIVGIISHWVLYNISSEKKELQEGVPQQESFSDGIIQGKNFFNRNAYLGPSPPFGTHRSRRIVFLDELRIGELYFRKGMVFQETRPRLISL